MKSRLQIYESYKLGGGVGIFRKLRGMFRGSNTLAVTVFSINISMSLLDNVVGDRHILHVLSQHEPGSISMSDLLSLTE